MNLAAIINDIRTNICVNCNSPAVGTCYLCPFGDDTIERTVNIILDAAADN